MQIAFGILFIITLSGCMASAPNGASGSGMNAKIIDENMKKTGQGTDDAISESAQKGPALPPENLNPVRPKNSTGDDVHSEGFFGVCFPEEASTVCPILEKMEGIEVSWLNTLPVIEHEIIEDRIKFNSPDLDVTQLRWSKDPSFRYWPIQLTLFLPLTCSEGTCSLGKPILSKGAGTNQIEREYFERHPVNLKALKIDSEDVSPLVREFKSKPNSEIIATYEIKGIKGDFSYTATLLPGADGTVSLMPYFNRP